MTSAPTPEPTLRDVISRLDTLTGNVERLSTDVEQLSTDVERLSTDVEQLSTDVEAGNSRFEKWDGRLWGLTLGLIGTAWTAIFAASAVVITRLLAGM
jgi:ABC-type transporter Mla subunit MlaD